MLGRLCRSEISTDRPDHRADTTRQTDLRFGLTSVDQALAPPGHDRAKRFFVEFDPDSGDFDSLNPGCCGNFAVGQLYRDPLTHCNGKTRRQKCATRADIFKRTLIAFGIDLYDHFRFDEVALMSSALVIVGNRGGRPLPGKPTKKPVHLNSTSIQQRCSTNNPGAKLKGPATDPR